MYSIALKYIPLGSTILPIIFEACQRSNVDAKSPNGGAQFLSTGDSKGDGVPFGRKNPKKPAVSWQGIQRGQRPLGTRLCSQSLVCYTFAKGMAADGLFCPPGRGQKKTDAGWNCGAIAAAGVSLSHPRSKGIPFLSQPSRSPRIPSFRHRSPAPGGITMDPWHQNGITLRHHP